VILLTLCHVESTSDSVGHKLVEDYSFFTGESGCASFSRSWITMVGHCLAVLRLGLPLELRGTLLCHCRALSRLRPELSGFWEDSETTSSGPTPSHFRCFSPRPVVVKLRLRSPPSGTRDGSLGCST